MITIMKAGKIGVVMTKNVKDDFMKLLSLIRYCDLEQAESQGDLFALQLKNTKTVKTVVERCRRKSGGKVILIEGIDKDVYLIVDSKAAFFIFEHFTGEVNTKARFDIFRYLKLNADKAEKT